MDMSEFNQSPKVETDLKAKDFVGKNLKLTIDRVELVTYPPFEGKAEQIKPANYFKDKTLRLIVNSQNNEVLCKAYGPDSDDWAGKEISLTTKDYSDKGYGIGWIVSPLNPDFDDDVSF